MVQLERFGCRQGEKRKSWEGFLKGFGAYETRRDPNWL